MAVTHAQTTNAQSVMYSQMLSDPSPHAYQLFVNRKNLIKDTMAQLVTSDALVNFKKPLVVCLSNVHKIFCALSIVLQYKQFSVC